MVHEAGTPVVGVVAGVDAGRVVIVGVVLVAAGAVGAVAVAAAVVVGAPGPPVVGADRSIDAQPVASIAAAVTVAKGLRRRTTRGGSRLGGYRWGTPALPSG